MPVNATAGLHKSEAQNTLARALFFNRLGELRDRTFESQPLQGVRAEPAHQRHRLLEYALSRNQRLLASIAKVL